MARAKGSHEHEALRHRHKHYHVTHYLHRGENWSHLLSTHIHEHNIRPSITCTSRTKTWTRSTEGRAMSRVSRRGRTGAEWLEVGS